MAFIYSTEISILLAQIKTYRFIRTFALLFGKNNFMAFY
jgi:hypothetical protein